MLANNFYDLRPVHGEAALFDALHRYALDLARENKIFLAYMTANALRSRPPLGFFRGFVLIRDGEHANTFDLKLGALMPITELARVYALSVGCDDVNTVNRLRHSAAANALSREGAANLIDALEFIGTLRVRHQAQQIKNGEHPDNYIQPDKLSPLERGHLKDVFSLINTMQDALGARYQAARFT
jgi:CBS domain-containing protein